MLQDIYNEAYAAGYAEGYAASAAVSAVWDLAQLEQLESLKQQVAFYKTELENLMQALEHKAAG